MSKILDSLLNLDGIIVYVVVGLLVFAEDGLLVGLVVPGETAAILGGVVASRGNAHVLIVTAVVVVAAILGDSLGYEIGVRFGPRITKLGFLQRRQERLEKAEEYLRRRGGPAVFLGRFVAFLRTVIPFLAGTSHMHYRRFLAYNVAGGVVWGVSCVLLGYLAGNSYRAIERFFGPATAVVVLVIAVAGLIVWRIRRHRKEGAE